MEDSTSALLSLPSIQADRRTTLAYTALVVAFLLCVIAWVAYQVFVFPARLIVEDSFCCPDVVRELAKHSNRSIDPCTKFLPYTCRDRYLFAGLTKYWTVTDRDFVVPILQGTTNNSAGRALHKYYASCIATIVADPKIVEKAVSAMMDISGVRSPLSPKEILKVIVELSLYYDTRFVMWVVFNETVGKKSLILEANSHAQEEYRPIQDQGYWRKIFLAITSRLPINVTLVGTVDMTAQLIRAASKNSTTLHGNSSILRYLSPAVSIGEWHLVLERVGVWSDSLQVIVKSITAIQRILDILTEPKRKDEATACLLTALTCSLAGPSLLARSRATTHKDLFQYCSLELYRQYPLWELAATTLFTSAFADSVVRTLYNLVLHEVHRSLSAAGRHCCSADIAIFVSKFRLILPSDVKFLPPPIMTEYWKNVLALRKYNRQMERLKNMTGVPRGLRSHRAYGIAYEEGVLYVPPAAYAFLQFTGRIEPFINAPIIGVDIADILWRAVSYDSVLNASVFGRLPGYKKCAYDEEICIITDLRFPLLSLSTVSAAVRTTTWHNPLPALMTWHISSSQAFYMIFFTHHICRPLLRIIVLKEEVTNRFIRMLPDFNEAFRCTDQPIMDNGSRF